MLSRRLVYCNKDKSFVLLLAQLPELIV